MSLNSVVKIFLVGGFLLCNCKGSVDPYKCEPVDPEIKNEPKLIINNDGGDAYGRSAADNEEDYINLRLRPMTASADYVFYSLGTSHFFSHNTNVGERLSNEFLSYLSSKKTDPLRIATEYVHSKGKKIFYSLRMNDTHDHTNDKLFPDWKVENSPAVVGMEGREYASGGQRWSAMDYEYDVTRDYVYRLLEEAILKYDIDGIELDFFRHPIFFGSQLDGDHATAYQTNILTELIERISNLCDKHGKKLAIRVPDSITYNSAIGIDLETWLTLGYIDIVSLSGYFHLSQWCAMANLKNLGDFELYACLSKSRLKNQKSGKILPDYYWYNEAARAMQNGYDGIYLFNVFQNDTTKYSLFDVESLNNNYDPDYEEQKGGSPGYWVRNGVNYFTY